RVDLCQTLWTAQSFQHLREPGARDDISPVGIGSRGLVGSNIGCCQQPHGFGEAEPLRGCDALYFAEAFDHAAQLRRIDLDPASSHPYESLRLSWQLLDLGGSQLFTVEDDFHVEVEQCLLADPGGRFAAHRARYPWARRTVA